MKSNNFFEHVGTKNLKTGYLSLFNFIKLTHQTIVSIIARLQHFTLRWNNYILRDDGGGGFLVHKNNNCCISSMLYILH